MLKKSNFCETHNQIHHCEFTSATFVAKKQEELISKRMNRLLNPAEYIKPSEDLKPKKGSFAHIIQNAKNKNKKIKSEVNFLGETKDDKIDEKTLTNRI